MDQGPRTTAVVLLSIIAAVDGARAAGPDDRRSLGDAFGRIAGSVRDRMLDVVGPDEIVERVDVNAVMERVDIDELLDRVDVNELLNRVDVNLLLRRVDVDALLDRVDVGRLLDRVDVDGLLSRVDVDRLLARVDPELVLDRVDVNALLDRVDVDHLLDRVDVARVVDRVDLDRLVARVDVDAVIDRVDVERVVQRAGIPDIVAESTGGLVQRMLDLARRQLLALDVIAGRAIMRLLRRDAAATPAGPPMLAGDGGPSYVLPSPDAPVADVTGHYAGPATRLAAHVIDVAVATTAFTLTAGAVSSVLDTIGLRPGGDGSGLLFGVAFGVWLFAYWWVSTAVAGRTPGMALVGLRIVTRIGTPLSGRQALVRVVVLPISIAAFGLGLVGILVDRERRGLHDLAAGSTVVYDWGDRVATLPTPLARWLARHAAPIDPTLDRRPTPTRGRGGR